VGSRDDNRWRGPAEPPPPPIRGTTLHPRLVDLRGICVVRRPAPAWPPREEPFPVLVLPGPRHPVLVPDFAPGHDVHAYRTPGHTKLCPHRRPPAGRGGLWRRGQRWRWRKLPRARSEGGSAALPPLFSTFLFWTRGHSPLAALAVHVPSLHRAATARPILTRANARLFCTQALHHGSTGVFFSRESVPPPTASDGAPTTLASAPDGKLPLCATLVQRWWQLIRREPPFLAVSPGSGLI